MYFVLNGKNIGENIIKSIAVTQNRSSLISNFNLEIKNLYSEFGIFLISKKE